MKDYLPDRNQIPDNRDNFVFATEHRIAELLKVEYRNNYPTDGILTKPLELSEVVRAGLRAVILADVAEVFRRVGL